MKTKRKMSRSIRYTLAGAILMAILGFTALHQSTVSAGDGVSEDAKNIAAAKTMPKATPEIVLIQEPTYTDQELDELSRLLCVECGSAWIPDEIQQYVASVVINRVNSPLYPDNIHDVLYQEGQYGPVMRGEFENAVPDNRTIENAKQILENGSILPGNVVFQDTEIQGDGIYCIYEDDILGTTYFCFTNKQ